MQDAAARRAPVDDRAQHAPVDDTEQTTEALFRRLRDATLSDGERRRARAGIIELNLALATRLTHRYRNRGQDADDLRQVAAIGLLKAVDGFDPDRGTPFFGYLIPTVTGELKRHFRDHGWDVHVPRGLQERYLAVTQARSELTQRLRRAPTVAEIGTALRLDEYDVIEALGVAAVYDVGSLNVRVSAEDDAGERQEFVGAEDEALVSVCDRLALRDLVRDLPERDRYILTRYFFGGATQECIGAALGMSQMNVSRLLRRTLDQLRLHLAGTAEAPPKPSYGGAGIIVDDTRQAIVVSVHGDADPALLRRALVDAAVRTRRGRVVVDLRHATGAGPGTARALVQAYRASGASGARIVAVNVPAALYDVLCRLGVARLLPCRSLTPPVVRAATGPAPGPSPHAAVPAATPMEHRKPQRCEQPSEPRTAVALSGARSLCRSRIAASADASRVHVRVRCGGGAKRRAPAAPPGVRARGP